MTRTRKARQRDDCPDSFDLTTITLLKGPHGECFVGEACLVEWSNRAAACVPKLRKKYGAEKFSDDHPSISRVVRAYGIALNDAMSDEERQTLKPYVTRILGTNTGPADEQARAWLATDWLVRVDAPAYLDLAGLTDEASKLRALPPLTSDEIALAVMDTLNEARSRAEAAGRAAGSAAWSAARSAARSAAWSAAERAAGSAAGSAAWSALEPTTKQLNAGALDLFDRLIAVGQTVESAR